jgi:DNA-binding XRE family transcriptional regulator
MPEVAGDRWKDRRAELDIPQERAAVLLGVEKRTLQNIETTSGYRVSLEVIHRAARLYRCSNTWLRGGDDAPPQPQPDPPRREPSGDPKGPDPRKNGKDNQRGPKRAADMRAAS